MLEHPWSQKLLFITLNKTKKDCTRRMCHTINDVFTENLARALLKKRYDSRYNPVSIRRPPLTAAKTAGGKKPLVLCPRRGQGAVLIC